MNINGSLVVNPAWRIGIVAARFNAAIVDDLVVGAIDCYVRHGLAEENIDVARCPGAFELTGVAHRMVAQKKYDAVIALGCVIRGDTPHFDQVVNAATKGVADFGGASPGTGDFWCSDHRHR